LHLKGGIDPETGEPLTEPAEYSRAKQIVYIMKQFNYTYTELMNEDIEFLNILELASIGDTDEQ